MFGVSRLCARLAVRAFHGTLTPNITGKNVTQSTGFILLNLDGILLRVNRYKQKCLLHSLMLQSE